jgi:hypothetical protein
MARDSEALGYLFALGMFCYAGYRFLIGIPTEYRYNQAKAVADTNKDNITSLDEWKQVYQEIGVRFDELNPEPLDQIQLADYLRKHHVKPWEYGDRKLATTPERSPRQGQ